MRNLIIPLTALSMVAGVAPALAQDDHGRGHDDKHGGYSQVRDDRHDDRRDDRHDDHHDDRNYRHDGRNDAFRANGNDWQRGRHYSYSRPDPRYGAYYADNYYHGGNGYRTRVLGPNDRIYRGRDNRYYCRRSDGTTGLIIGAISGGTLGNVIAPGGSKTLGSLLGGSLGAILGSSIDRGNITCR